VEIEVTFDINADGIVSVSAKDLETGQEQAITVTATSGLSEDEINHMMRENREYLVDVRTNEELEMHRVSIQRSVMRDRPHLPQGAHGARGLRLRSGRHPQGRGRARTRPTRPRRHDVAALKTANEQLSRTLNMFRGVVQKIG
jgi:molecular chaperone DnaK